MRRGGLAITARGESVERADWVGLCLLGNNDFRLPLNNCRIESLLKVKVKSTLAHIVVSTT